MVIDLLHSVVASVWAHTFDPCPCEIVTEDKNTLYDHRLFHRRQMIPLNNLYSVMYLVQQEVDHEGDVKFQRSQRILSTVVGEL